MTTTYNFAIRADLLEETSLFMSNEKTRYYLCGVAIDFREGRKGARLVATNGHILGLMHDTEAARGDNDTSSPYDLPIVSAETIAAHKTAAKVAKNLKGPLWLTIKGDGVSARAAYIVANSACDAIARNEGTTLVWQGVVNPLIDGTFPNYRRVLPDCAKIVETSGPVTFDPRYAAPFNAIAAKGLTRSGVSRPITLYQSEQTARGPMLVTVEERPEFVGVWMPMRNSTSTTSALAAAAVAIGDV